MQVQLGRHGEHLWQGQWRPPKLSPRAIRDQGRTESKAEPSSAGLDFLLHLGLLTPNLPNLYPIYIST